MKKLPDQDIYQIKKSKQPDFLYNLIKKKKFNDENQQQSDSIAVKDVIKKVLIQKRVDNIMKNVSKTTKVSKAESYVTKKWVSPLLNEG